MDDKIIEPTEVFGINIVFNDPSSTGCTGKVIPPSKAYVTIHDSGTSKYWIIRNRLMHRYVCETDLVTDEFMISSTGRKIIQISGIS